MIKFNYIDKYNIHRIFLNYYMDKNNINSMTFIDLLGLDNFKEFADMYSAIICRIGKSKNDVNISNITLREFKHQYNDDRYEKSYSLFSKQLPIEILEFMHIKPDSKKYSNVVQCEMSSSSKMITYRNFRDSVLFFNDLDKLNFNISKLYSDYSTEYNTANDKEKIKTNEILNKIRSLFTMQFRLIIPKYLYDKIYEFSKIDSLSEKMKYCLYRSEHGYIQFVNMLTNKERLDPKYIDKIRYITDEGTINLDQLPGSVMYDVYFNLNFNDINKLINNISPYEEDYKGQVIGAIYYNLLKYSGIMTIGLDVHKNIEDDIIKRIYRRVGN